jgi:hypothetical protein
MQFFKFSWVFPGKDRRVGERSVAADSRAAANDALPDVQAIF